MPTSTTRLALQQPVGSDPPSELRVSITTNANILDNAVTFSKGTLAALPAPALAGRRYYATDAGIELWDTGTSWVPGGGTSVPVGAMAQWSLATDPVDSDGVTRWLIADGRQISRNTYSRLSSIYSAAGYPWGNGNGSTTFNIPDTRSRALVGPDTGLTTGAAGRIPTQNTLGAFGGTQAVTLAGSESGTNGLGTSGWQSSDHSHSGVTGYQNGNQSHTHYAHNPPINPGDQGWSILWWGTQPQGAGGQYPKLFYNNNYSQGVLAYVDSTNTDHTHNFATGGASANHYHQLNARGADAAHTNLQPYLVVCHIIKVL